MSHQEYDPISGAWTTRISRPGGDAGSTFFITRDPSPPRPRFDWPGSNEESQSKDAGGGYLVIARPPDPDRGLAVARLSPLIVERGDGLRQAILADAEALLCGEWCECEVNVIAAATMEPGEVLKRERQLRESDRCADLPPSIPVVHVDHFPSITGVRIRAMRAAVADFAWFLRSRRESGTAAGLDAASETPKSAGEPRVPAPAASETWPTKGDLTAAAGISGDTFNRVRGDAGIVVTETGGAARHRRYSPDEVDRMIAAAAKGNRMERNAMREKWAKWGNKGGN